MPQTVLLRLTDAGTPVPNAAVHNGVLILPAVPKAPGAAALFNLVFRLDAAAPVTHKGALLTNVPDAAAPFARDTFRRFALRSSLLQDVSVTVPIHRPGPYCFYIEYEAGGRVAASPRVHFTVPPQLVLGGAPLPPNALSVQTVVSKWAGPLEQWGALLAYIAAKGYNMVHFTPLQQRGASNSPYAIYDQLRFDPALFASNAAAEAFLHKALPDHGLLAMTDVVWNHTAHNSAWLRDSPDSGYNADTAPHLAAAIELDSALLDFSDHLADYALPTTVRTEADLLRIMDAVQPRVLDPLRLWQYYVFDKDATLAQLQKVAADVAPADVPPAARADAKSLAAYVLAHATAAGKPVLAGRFANEVDPRKLMAILLASEPAADAIPALAARVLDELNAPLYAEYDDDVASIKAQLLDRARFLRLADNGPRLGAITREHRFAEPYFTRFTDARGKPWALANNGWIWGGNPLVDFASDQSRAYLRREVIVWGDCVKLRYGSGPQDSPALWRRMTEYTRQCAAAFDAFRLDNCHSTPLHVGEALLDAARAVNPDLYVVAELFSGSEQMDQVFVERLGINSLIREAMSAGTVGELSRLAHRHGGRPIGSLSWMPLDDVAYPAGREPEPEPEPESGTRHGGHSELEIPRVLAAQAPHALFMDCTHDNQTPAQLRTVEDTLPTAAVVSFCSAAVGSVFGYDEAYPELLDVVRESRRYQYRDDSGIGAARRRLNAVRTELGHGAGDAVLDHEMYVHHEGQYITIQRYNTRTGKGKFLIARSSFAAGAGDQVLSPVRLAGTEVTAEFAYTLARTGDAADEPGRISGIPTRLTEISCPAVRVDGDDATIAVDGGFAPGSIAVYTTRVPAASAALDEFATTGAVEASARLDLCDLNAVLYRCEPEERDASGGADGTYDLPGHGRLVYAGLEGWVRVMKPVVWGNNLAHPFCSHLRQGLWAADSVVARLDKYARASAPLAAFQDWLRSRMAAVAAVPDFLRPHYFALVVGVAYEAARFRALRLMAPDIRTAAGFVQSLALTSVQMCGRMANTSLVPGESTACLAAGLPHFSNDYMRCWGRDVFISFRGLLVACGRFGDARRHILAFAQTLKHGLIPNLLDAGRNPRYNARDAAWFFAQAVQEYVVHAPDGESILDEVVARRFPLDDTWVPHDDARAYSRHSSVRDILYEILARHARGISYREANAGPGLDSQMSDAGFNVEIAVDWDTGLIHGGSQANCGTWMDKMGESERAGSKGVPGTPRDGAAVELQGLLKSTLRFVNGLHARGLFEHTEVTRGDGTTVSLRDWEALVQRNFERCFYVPEDPRDDAQYAVNSAVVHRRGIYKDLYRSGKEYEDYQLRANFPIAMCVAPELFSADHARVAINNADRHIRGPVGMRTLDPADWNYRPYYNNGEDSADFATAKGRNYHQGPEWVWCFGYFIRAFLRFNHAAHGAGPPADSLLRDIGARLEGHRAWIRDSPWAGLTELTNKDGEVCGDSSPTQAWSSSCLLDLYFDLWKDEQYRG